MDNPIIAFFVTAYEQMIDSFINNPFAQAIGALALILSLLSFQMRKRRTILLFQMLASLSCATSLIMLGGIAGGILDVIAFSRTLVFSLSDKYRWAGSKACLFSYFAIIVAVGILTWEYGSIAPLFAILGTLLSTLALFMKSERNIRLISLLVAPPWIAYNLIYSSCFGILNELIAMTSIIIALFRMRKSRSQNIESTTK